LRDICVCRTGALGGHRDVCGDCGLERPVFNSCRNRHCPKCQALRQARWVSARMERALPVRHFHLVFTLPSELRPLVRHNPGALLELLFEAAAGSIVALSCDPKRLGALVGVTAVVHTWARNLSYHPHLHCIVTAGGLAPDGRWVDSAERYLLPVKALGALFRGKFVAGFARLHEQGRLVLGGPTAALADRAAFARFKDALYAKQWQVHAKAPFGSPRALFKYLGLYTHRVAISNHRLLEVSDDEIVFRTRGDQVCRLAPGEFIRRFLQHVLPRGFVKVRHFGLYAAGNVRSRLAVARAALEARAAAGGAEVRAVVDVGAASLDWRELLRSLTGIDIGLCPDCGTPLRWEPLASPASLARAPPDTS
jgi:hypothetical protein